MKSRLLLAAIFIAAATTAARADRKPNILVIVADDLGYGETTAQGFTDQIPTPHIDSIARNGIRFTDGYVSGPYCSPSRAGLVTGRYQERFGHEFNPGAQAPGKPAPGLPLKETTFGDRLRAAGYATGWFGKSHLGFAPRFHPQRRGFDEFYGFFGASHSYVRPEQGRRAVFDGFDPVAHPGYLTETFARKAADFIERKKDVPWFVYLPFNAVHAPLETLRRYDARFSSIKNPDRRKFAALLAALDDSVGTVLGKLRELNLEEDTLIFFISDNGGPTRTTTSGNGPLKGYKAETSEGGIRVPFFVQWKGKLPAGEVDPRPVIQLDILPTSLAAAGVNPAPAGRLDGVNLLPYLTGANAGHPHEALYWRFGRQLAIRQGNWKLVKSTAEGTPFGEGTASTKGAKLYNLARDVGEKHNLADEEPEKVKELAGLWNAWNATLVDAKWPPAERGIGLSNHPSGKDIEALDKESDDGDDGPLAPPPDWARKASDPEKDASVSSWWAEENLTISANIEAEEDPDGVIAARGGKVQGYALQVKDGRLALSVRRGGELSSISAAEYLDAGPSKVAATVSPQGHVTLEVNGRRVGDGYLAEPFPLVFGDKLTLGDDTGSAVGDYITPNPFTGKVSDLFEKPPGSTASGISNPTSN